MPAYYASRYPYLEAIIAEGTRLPRAETYLKTPNVTRNPALPTKHPIYVIQHNHFDPIWRRCWDRSFDYRGKRMRSYADIEERVINAWLETAKRGAAFSEGQAVVFRKYLERNPDRLADLRKLVKGGLIDLTAAGETVADTNMPSGETLLRNLVMGQLYFEETFGVIPSVGWLEDAFGQSAQMPQLFRGVECTSVQRLSYKRVPGDYWRGLDGSVVYTGLPGSCDVGTCVKNPPCPACNGMGCDDCEQSGFVGAARIDDEAAMNAFVADHVTEPCTLISLGGEETMPNPRVVELVERARREHGVDIRFGGYGEVTKHLNSQLAAVDDPNVEASGQVEANPVSTGCYVTRIRIKQEFRRIENMLNSAERWAAVAHLLGAEYPTECLTEAWRSLLFAAFHDAITSTHVDQAYYELQDMLSEAEHEATHVLADSLASIGEHIEADPCEDYVLLFNSQSWERDDPVTVTLSGTTGCPVVRDASGAEVPVLDVIAQGADTLVTFRPPKVPALGYAALNVVTDGKPMDSGEVTHGPGEIENEFFTVRVSDRGIESILDKRTGREAFDTSSYCVNELLLEEDIGHPWGTMQPPGPAERLAQYTTGTTIRKSAGLGEITVTGQYKGDDPNVKVLTWRQSIKLYAGYDRIDFVTSIDWDTAQRRIRVAFPTGIKTNSGVYSIPYGAVSRSAYEPDMNNMSSTNGDWPAVNWVDVYDEDADRGVALINTGTPSHKVEDGVLYMSFLRSPTDSWCLNEPEFYDCPDFDGARDAGSHEFAYSLIPHSGDWRAAGIEKRGREVNCPLQACGLAPSGKGKLGLTHSFITFDAGDNVIVTAIKKAERGNGVVVRLAETSGRPGSASISIPNAGKKLDLVNYLERHPEPVSGSISLGPFKVVTCLFGGSRR